MTMGRQGSLCLTVIAALVSIFCGGCGGGSSDSTSGGSKSSSLSQAQAQAVTEQISEAVAQALQSAFSSSAAAPSLAAVVRDARLDEASGCTPTATGETCDWPISYDGACPQGGTLAVAGDIDGTLNSAGSGSVSSQLTITPANCAVSSLVINGDPNIDVGLSMSFANSAPLFPITLTETGGISYGPNPSGSCTFNVTYAITSQTSCTITGTACGQSVSGGC